MVVQSNETYARIATLEGDIWVIVRNGKIEVCRTYEYDECLTVFYEFYCGRKLHNCTVVEIFQTLADLDNDFEIFLDSTELIDFLPKDGDLCK